MRRSSISSSDRGAIFRRTLAAVLLTGWCVLGASWVLLWRSGETDLDGTVRDQIATGGMANLLSVPFYSYKRAMYAAIRPEATALGSSRSLQFRSYMFGGTFYNLGGGPKDIDSAFAVADDLLLHAPPKLLVLTLDIWSFWSDRKVSQDQARRPHGLPAAATTSINQLILPIDLLLRGRLQWANVLAILGRRAEPPIPAFGLYARVHTAGFAADGSGLQIHRLDKDLLLPAGERFREALDTIGRPGSALLPGTGDAVDERQIALLRLFVKELGASGIVVVPVIVPVSPMVMAAIRRSNAYGYIEKARAALRRDVPEVIDLLDPETIGAPDCEFYDGTHGGEITYARIALKIAETRPALARYFATERLREVIGKYAGYSTAPVDRVARAYVDRFETYFKETACRP